MKHSLVEVEGASIAATTRACAAPVGAPLVILHGFGESPQRWAELADHLAADRTVHILELPGHGQSQVACATDYGYERQTALLTAASAMLSDNAPLHLLGYSMGGRLALGMALHWPSRWRSLTLISTHPGLRTPEERSGRIREDAEWVALLRSGDMATFARLWLRRGLFRDLPERVAGERAASIASQTPDRLRQALTGAGLGQQPDHMLRLPELTIPALIVAGEEDDKFTALARTMHAAIAGSELQIVPGAGHAVHEGGSGLAFCLRHWLRQKARPDPIHKPDSHGRRLLPKAKGKT